MNSIEGRAFGPHAYENGDGEKNPGLKVRRSMK